MQLRITIRDRHSNDSYSFIPCLFFSLSCAGRPWRSLWIANRGAALPVRVYQSGRVHHLGCHQVTPSLANANISITASKIAVMMWSLLTECAHDLFVWYKSKMFLQSWFISYLPCHDCNFSFLWINLPALKRSPQMFTWKQKYSLSTQHPEAKHFHVAKFVPNPPEMVQKLNKQVLNVESS